MTVVDISKQPTFVRRRKHSATRTKLLVRGQLRNKAAIRFDKLVRAIQADLGGYDALSAIEREMIECFAGACLLSQHFTARLLLADTGTELDASTFATASNAVSRLGGQLGLSRRQREIGCSLGELLRQGQKDAGHG